jgi:hypothetical protein
MATNDVKLVCTVCGARGTMNSAAFYAPKKRYNTSDVHDKDLGKVLPKMVCGFKGCQGTMKTENVKLRTHKKSCDKKVRSSMKG